MLKYNYHGHTRWCRHAGGEIEDYIVKAIELGMDVVAISEHVPLPNKTDRFLISEMDEFFADFDRVIAKYGSQIKILKAFECEYLPNCFDHYREIKEKYNVDYLVLGHHYLSENDNFFLGWIDEPTMLKRYVDTMIEAMESGLYAFVAHPDVFGIAYHTFDEHVIEAAHRIFAAAERLDIPLEFNANGLRRPKVDTPTGARYQYPWLKFWEIAKEYNVKVLINSDCHSVDCLYDKAMTKAFELAKQLDLNIVDTFKY